MMCVYTAFSIFSIILLIAAACVLFLFTPSDEMCGNVDLQKRSEEITNKEWIDTQWDDLVINLLCIERCPCPLEVEEFWPGKVFDASNNVNNW